MGSETEKCKGRPRFLLRIEMGLTVLFLSLVLGIPFPTFNSKVPFINIHIRKTPLLRQQISPFFPLRPKDSRVESARDEK